MCEFKSGIIRKHRIDLAPKGNESHSDLLQKLGIVDNYDNAARVFVRAELIPPNNNVGADIKDWKFIVDQDITPDWFNEDRGRYEKEFREAVTEWVKENMAIFAGMSWTAIKKDGDYTYYLLDSTLGDSDFGKNNNYETSNVRKKLNNGDLCKKLKAEFGDRLIPITTDLLSLDGENEYGIVKGDVLSLMTLDLYRECKNKIPKINSWYWLATPYSTPQSFSSGYVCYVSRNGNVDYDWCYCSRAVRPFFILKSSNL